MSRCPLCNVDPDELVHRGLLEAEHHRAEEMRVQLANVTTRLISQRRRLAELESLQTKRCTRDYQRGILDAAAWLRHIDRLDQIGGARGCLPEQNPLWDASFAMEQVFGVSSVEVTEIPARCGHDRHVLTPDGKNCECGEMGPRIERMKRRIEESDRERTDD